MVEWVDGSLNGIDVETDRDELARQILPKYGMYVSLDRLDYKSHRLYVSKGYDPKEVYRYLKEIFG